MRCMSCLSILSLLKNLFLLVVLRYEALALDEACNNVVQNWSGSCVVARQCGAYTRSPSGQEFLRNNFCYYNSGREPVVCCPSSDTAWLSSSSSIRPPSQQPSYNELMLQPSDNYSGPLFKPYCGFSGIKRYKVVGGQPAPLGAWPWIVALGYRNPDDPKTPKWLCGGTLVSAQHVLTAGHCVYNRTDLYLARLGEHDLVSTRDGAHPMDLPITLGIIHPGYSHVNYVNDIALLKLKKPVTFTSAIHPICLPVDPELRYKDYTGSFPFIAGWGALYFHGPTSSVLQEVQLPVVPQSNCKNVYSAFKEQIIDDRVMCAGYTIGGKDACKGDSGGPLMTAFNETYFLIGVVSYGYRCAEPGIPGVYTKVPFFMDFIINNLKE